MGPQDLILSGSHDSKAPTSRPTRLDGDESTTISRFLGLTPEEASLGETRRLLIRLNLVCQGDI